MNPNIITTASASAAAAVAATTAASHHHTPSAEAPRSHSRTRVNNHHAGSANIPSRPTTPLRPPSRTSLRASQTTPTAGNLVGNSSGHEPLSALEPAFAELADGMADLEANMMHLQLLNESLGRFNENFGAFLYGMNMSAFCVDFPEAPIPQSFARHRDSTPNELAHSPFHHARVGAGGPDNAAGDATFLTTDTSFVENPPTSSKPASKYSSVPASTATARRMMTRGGVGRGGSTTSTTTTTGAGGTRGRGAGGSGIARGSGTMTRGGRGGGSGIARGIPRGRGSGVR